MTPKNTVKTGRAALSTARKSVYYTNAPPNALKRARPAIESPAAAMIEYLFARA